MNVKKTVTHAKQHVLELFEHTPSYLMKTSFALFFLVAAAQQAYADSFQLAGGYDGDIALVDVNSVKPFNPNETVTIFQWALAHGATVLQVDGKDYDSVVETVIVDCARPSTRYVAESSWQYRDLSGVQGSAAIAPIKTQSTPDGENTKQIQTSEKSPAGLAIKFACKLAESKTNKKPFTYKDPTHLVNPIELICEVPPDYQSKQSITVSFSESQGLIQAGVKVASDSSITKDTLGFSLRTYYGGPVIRKMRIFRHNGELVAEKTDRYPEFSMSCRHREKNKF